MLPRHVRRGPVHACQVTLSSLPQAVCADGVRTRTIPVRIREEIPEPLVTPAAPATWDGRETIEVVAQIANLGSMEGKGAAPFPASEPVLRRELGNSPRGVSEGGA